MITRVTGRNQVTIPAEIAKMADIHAGTRLEWRPTDREHVLEVHVLSDQATLAAQLRGRGRRFMKAGADPVANLMREREEEDAERGG